MGIELLKNQNAKDEWKGKRERIINDKIDVTEFMIDIVEKFGYAQ